MNAILSARNDTDQSVKIREIKNRRIIMEVRTAASPRDVKHYTTDRLREEFLIQDLFQADKINLVYSHIDRIITGAAVPVNENWF